MTSPNLPIPGVSSHNEHMKLRFGVNQAECFRKGINCPKSITTVEVDPAELPQSVRDLIADRLSGIDVCVLEAFADTVRPATSNDYDPGEGRYRPVLIEADGLTFEDLKQAVVLDQQRFMLKNPNHPKFSK
jgi:hypothetical protein